VARQAIHDGTNEDAVFSELTPVKETSDGVIRWKNGVEYLYFFY